MVQQKRRRRLPNRVIVSLKLLSALGLFFSCCLFVFVNLSVFQSDFGFNADAPLGSAQNPWYNLAFALVFILGLCFVVYYVANMIIRFQTKEIWKADRLYVLYQIVFNGLLIITIWRWFFISISNAVAPSIIMLVSGFLNLITPRIVDNNNRDF